MGSDDVGNEISVGWCVQRRSTLIEPTCRLDYLCLRKRCGSSGISQAAIEV